MNSILDYEGSWPGTGMDLSDQVLHVCVCGSNMWKLVVTFSDYEIASYSLDMECLECGTRAKAPTPLDAPG
jgi:hypothetical protein